jgi:hypothetical protein
MIAADALDVHTSENNKYVRIAGDDYTPGEVLDLIRALHEAINEVAR